MSTNRDQERKRIEKANSRLDKLIRENKKREKGYHFELDKTRIPKTWVLVKDRN